MLYNLFMGAKHTLWHSYSLPTDLEKDLLSQEERVLLILRAHPVTTTPWILIGTGLVLIPLFFSPYLSLLKLNPNQELFLIVVWYALAFSYLLSKFFFWYFNLGVVTNQKIVDVDANNLLNTVTTATVVGKVEEVNKKSLGIISSYFDFGDIYIETAGEIPNIEFLKVPHPSEVVKLINSNVKLHGPNKHR